MFQKILFLFIVLVGGTISIHAQTGRVLSATVKDGNTQQPIEYATIELLSKSDSLLATCITNATGHFEITPPLATVRLRVRFVGYKAHLATLKDLTTGIIFLHEDATQLRELTVKGTARANKVDRDVYVITKKLKSGTTSSQELLGKLTGVSFNYYDKSVSVNGSTKVLILVDGIEKDQQYAKTLAPDRIEKVEVIKDPIGKYATDGYTAVINIMLKKNYSGIDININNSSFFDIVGSNRDDYFAQDYADLNVSYTYKKLNVYSSANFYMNSLNLPMSYYKQYGMVTTYSAPVSSDNPNSHIQDRNGQFSLGADYSINPGHNVSMEMKYSKSTENNTMQYQITNLLPSGDISRGEQNSKQDYKSKNLQTSVAYHGQFDANNRLEAELRYTHTNGYSNDFLWMDNFSDISHVDLTSDYTKLDLTYNHRLGKIVDVDLGYGNIFYQNVSAREAWSLTRNNYRNRLSAYVNFRPLDKISTRFGAIVEHYSQHYADVNKTITAVMPYVNIQFIPSTKFNMVAKYHATTSYPDINQLVPFKTAQDSLLYQVGNPGLKTSVYHTLSLDFNLLGMATFTPYFCYDNTHISTYVFSDPEEPGKYISKTINTDSYRRYGLTSNFTVPFATYFVWQTNLDLYSERIAYHEANTVGKLGLNSNLMYVNEKKGWLSGIIVQKQLGRVATVQGYTSTGNDIVLFMLRKSLLEQKLNLSFYYMLPVNVGMTYDAKSKIAAQGYLQYSNQNLDLIKNLVFLEISYRFNSGKDVKARKQKTDNDQTSTKKGGVGL